jgi:hypothetical protein
LCEEIRLLRNFANRFAHLAETGSADLPDGQFCKIRVQPSGKKYFACPVGQITFTDFSRLAPQEGRIAIVTDVGRGSDGRGGVVDE